MGREGLKGQWVTSNQGMLMSRQTLDKAIDFYCLAAGGDVIKEQWLEVVSRCRGTQSVHFESKHMPIWQIPCSLFLQF